MKNVSTIIELTRNANREEMFTEILKSSNEYQEANRKLIELHREIIRRAPDDKYRKLFLDMESAEASSEALACDLVYEKGVQDGIQQVLSCIVNGSIAEAKGGAI